MSNTFQSVSSAFAELKYFYQGPIVDQFNEENELYRGLEKGKFPWSGYQVARPIKVRRNQGIGATSDGGILPQIGAQVTVQAQISAKYNYLRFGITGPMIKSSKSDVGSFVRGVEYEMTEGMNDLKSDVNRQLGWNGNGTLATVNTTAVASTALVIAGRESTEPALKFVDVGLQFDIYTSAGVLVQAGVTVTAIPSADPSGATQTLTVSPAVSCSATDVLVRANSYGQEVQGILTQLDGNTSTVFNIDRSSYPQTQGNVINLSGAALSLNGIEQAFTAVRQRGGYGLSAIYSDTTSQQMYTKLLQADKRYVNTMKGDGGFANKDKTYLAYNEIPWISDKDAPTRIFVLPSKHIEKYVLCELEWADETGAPLIAQTENDSFEARLRFFFNVFNSKAAASAVIRNYVSP